MFSGFISYTHSKLPFPPPCCRWLPIFQRCVKVFDLESYRQISSLKVTDDRFRPADIDMKFGKALVTDRGSGTVRVFDASKGQPMTRFVTLGEPSGICISDDVRAHVLVMLLL